MHYNDARMSWGPNDIGQFQFCKKLSIVSNFNLMIQGLEQEHQTLTSEIHELQLEAIQAGHNVSAANTPQGRSLVDHDTRSLEVPAGGNTTYLHGNTTASEADLVRQWGSSVTSWVCSSVVIHAIHPKLHHIANVLSLHSSSQCLSDAPLVPHKW